MPVNKHLKYQEITDFSPGLFTDGSAGTVVLAPAMAAQQMDDVYPQPQGGLRAFFTSTSVPTAGIVAPTQEECTGIFTVSGYSRRTGAGGETGTVWYMSTWNNTTNVARIYRMDGTNGETSWTALFTSVTTADNAASRTQSSFARFVDVSGNDYMVVCLRSGFEDTSRGVFTVTYVGGALPQAGDAVVTKRSAKYGMLAIAQARIIVSGTLDDHTADTLYWTGVGSASFSGVTSGNLKPQASAPDNLITYLGVIDPDQLIVGFRAAAWVTITGDINSSSTPVRVMGAGHYPPAQDALRTPGGVVFMANNGPAYLTTGTTFEDMTPQLAGFQPVATHFKGPGVGVFDEGFLLLPGGLVRYEETENIGGGAVMHSLAKETKGWFHVSDQTSVFHSSDPQLGIVTASAGVSFTIRLRVISRILGTRASAWTWRSAPFAQPDETQTEVREVTLQGECYTASTYAVTVTDHLGNTQTVTTASIPTGKHNFAVPTMLRGDYCDVKVLATAINGSSEAPTLEKIRIGFGMGHSL